jgi:hypothetical protein
MSRQAYPAWFDRIREGLGNPQLAFTVWPAYRERVYFQRDEKPKVLPDRDWYFLDHQTAGVCCHGRSFWASRVEPTREALEGMKLVERRWWGTNLGRGPSLASCVEYSASLQNVFGSGVGCERSFLDLEEGLYPIDLTRQAVGKLAAENMASSLEKFRYQDTENYLFPSPGLKLFIIGANSD